MGMEYLLNQYSGMKLRVILFLISILGFNVALSQTLEPKWGEWEKWGDQNDGTYCNPVIPSDYSDLDCIKVGNDYYAITSTFQFSPGMTILHSEDLVNWEICGHAVSDIREIGPELNWDRMNRYGKGIWAGTLRYHKGRFYVFFGTPDEGFFMTSSRKAEGPWEPLTQLLDESGWDDCTVMWDDDGSAYFVGTHFADGYKTYLFKMSSDGKSIDKSSGILINEGNGREASKLLKIGNWYYLIFSEHKSGIGRYVMAKRSKSLTGPYEEERQLALPCVEAMEPNQGGIVEGKPGEWYFFTHHGSGDWSGRIASLLPVTWIDEWPIIGKVVGDTIGSMVWSGKMPFIGKRPYKIATDDDFNKKELNVHWQWNYYPRTDKYSLSERKGWLRLKAFKPLKEDNLMYAGNTLTQRCFRTKSSEVTVKLDISGLSDGQKVGLCHFSSHSGAIGIVKEGDKCFLEYRQNEDRIKGTVIEGPDIWLKSIWGLDGISKFYYSLNGEDYICFGDEYQLGWGYYRGDRIGIYCFNDESETGYVDVDFFRYDMK